MATQPPAAGRASDQKAAALAKAVEVLGLEERVSEKDERVIRLAQRWRCRPAAIVSAHQKLCGPKIYRLHGDVRDKEWTLGEVLAPLRQQAVDDVYAYIDGQAPTSESAPADPRELQRELSLFWKQPACYVDRSGEIGVYYRWLVAIELLCDVHELTYAQDAAGDAQRQASDISPHGIFVQKLRAMLSPDPDDPTNAASSESADGTGASLAKRFSLAFHPGVDNQCQKPAHYSRAEPWARAIHLLLRRHRAAIGAPDLAFKDILEIPITHPGERLGRGVFDRFRVWLEYGWVPARDDLTRLHAEVFLAGEGPTPSARRQQLDWILSTMLDEVPPAGGCPLSATFPVLNIVSPKNWHGMRALATQLLIELKQRQYRHRKPYGLIYVPLSKGITEDRQRLTRSGVTDMLYDALHLQRPPSRSSVPEDDLSELDTLRAALTRRRTLVVFDGLEISAKPFDAVFDVLKHTDWPTYIKTLIQPTLDVLEEFGGEYPSRFLILSGQPVEALRPWAASHALSDDGDALLLEPPPDPSEALKLIKKQDGGIVDAWLARIRGQCELLWPGGNGPDTNDHGLSLLKLYQLEPDTVAKVETASEPVRLPDELDMATLWCEQQLGVVDLYASQHAAQDLHVAAERRLRIFRTFLHEGRSNAGETVALHFISVALKGLRLTTLRRCLKAYLDGCADDTSGPRAQSIDALIEQLSGDDGAKAFAEKYHPLIVLGHDEELEGVGELQRWFELQSLHKEHDGRVACAETALLDIRLVELRELLLDDLLNPSPSASREEHVRQRHNFELISRILAEEALSEATAQLRGLPRGADINAYTMRRMIQAVYHGLMSISFEADWDPTESKGPVAGADVRGSHLPENPYKRYIYLYEFVFRRCIDNAPEWLLGRGIGRFDVRLALMSMFVSPGWARRVLASLYRRPLSERSFEAFGAFAPQDDALPRGHFRSPIDSRAAHLRGALGIDLFKALLHSAARAGRQVFVAEHAEYIGKVLTDAMRATPPAVADRRDAVPLFFLDTALSALNSLRDSLQATAPLADSALQERFAFAKLAIDAQQALLKTKSAQQACLEWLGRFGVRHDATLLALGEQLDTASMDKHQFEQTHLAPIVTQMLKSGISKKALNCVSDLYFRLGELLASEADASDSRNYRQAATEYAHSYAAYWIGDRVRSGAATSDPEDCDWPAISARAMRYYVRISLKLSKLCARIHANPIDPAVLNGPSLVANASAFFAHARGRIDVYSRHLYRLPAERLAMHLLLASAARVWGSVSRLTQTDAMQDERALVKASLDYIAAAETLLVELGYLESKARRLLFERVKTLRRLDEIDRGANPAIGRIIARDMSVLRRLSRDHPSWAGMVNRIDKRREGSPATTGVV